MIFLTFMPKTIQYFYSTYNNNNRNKNR